MKRKGILVVGLLLLGLGLSQVGPFRARLEAAVRDGGTEFARVMLSQDKAQALCTQYRDKLPADLIPTFLAEQRALIQYPEGGKLMGDWRKGQEIFTDPKRGNCYACHSGDPDEVAYGTIGPISGDTGPRGASARRSRGTFTRWSTTPGPTSPAPSCTGVGSRATSPPRRPPTSWPSSLTPNPP
jgi:sulfur-oxidizing protein SoxX